MIQRIQTLYLFLSLVFLGLMFAFPFTIFIDRETTEYVFNFSGVLRLEDGQLVLRTVPPDILLTTISVINFVTIFLFKNRILQMRLTVLNMLLMAGLLILTGYYVFFTRNQLDAQVYYKITLLFPLISLLLTWLAFRNIRKDELLIRSVDRIR